MFLIVKDRLRSQRCLTTLDSKLVSSSSISTSSSSNSSFSSSINILVHVDATTCKGMLVEAR